MLWSQRFFPDLESSLKEGLRLHIVALHPVEDRQVGEGSGQIGMLRSAELFPDLERLLKEWLCEREHGMFSQIGSCAVKDVRPLREQELILPDEQMARLRL